MPTVKPRATVKPLRRKAKGGTGASNPPLTAADTPLLAPDNMQAKTLWPVALGSAHYMFICAVVRLGDNAYEAAIRQWFDAHTGKKINPGHISLTGKTLVETHGLLTVEKRPSPAGKGKKVNVYAVTPRGKSIIRQLQAAREAWELAISD